jgi:hypothetical protein
MISPPSTYLLSALVWQPTYASWSDGRRERGSYVVPDDSDCSRRSFTLAGWSEKQKAYYYVPDSPGCSLVYQREGYSINWRYLRRWEGQPTDEQNPRFFLHDDGTFAFSKYRFPSEDPVKIWRASTGPPFQFFQTDEKDVTPDEFFHDDVQLNMPDLPGQPYAGAKHLPFPEADEYGYDSDASDSSLENGWYTRWARDIKWGQESGLAIGSIRRIIWQGDHWGIEFNLEVMHRTIDRVRLADSGTAIGRTGTARIQGAF